MPLLVCNRPRDPQEAVDGTRREPASCGELFKRRPGLGRVFQFIPEDLSWYLRVASNRELSQPLLAACPGGQDAFTHLCTGFIWYSAKKLCLRYRIDSDLQIHTVEDGS